jgi:hypothetical protein
MRARKYKGHYHLKRRNDWEGSGKAIFSKTDRKNRYTVTIKWRKTFERNSLW